MNFATHFLPSIKGKMDDAFSAMAQPEKGATANSDEHYRLRNSVLTPTPAIRLEETTVHNIKAFAAEVPGAVLRGANGPLLNPLLIRIRGSAPGPRFVANALGHPRADKLKAYFFDNTDPDGMDRVLEAIVDELGQTLSALVSKSGGTKETGSAMLQSEGRYAHGGLLSIAHVVAVTSGDSQLGKYAAEGGWLHRLPIWDGIGGRTCETLGCWTASHDASSP